MALLYQLNWDSPHHLTDPNTHHFLFFLIRKQIASKRKKLKRIKQTKLKWNKPEYDKTNKHVDKSWKKNTRTIHERINTCIWTHRNPIKIQNKNYGIYAKDHLTHVAWMWWEGRAVMIIKYFLSWSFTLILDLGSEYNLLDLQSF